MDKAGDEDAKNLLKVRLGCTDKKNGESLLKGKKKYAYLDLPLGEVTNLEGYCGLICKKNGQSNSYEQEKISGTSMLKFFDQITSLLHISKKNYSLADESRIKIMNVTEVIHGKKQLKPSIILLEINSKKSKGIPKRKQNIEKLKKKLTPEQLKNICIIEKDACRSGAYYQKLNVYYFVDGEEKSTKLWNAIKSTDCNQKEIQNDLKKIYKNLAYGDINTPHLEKFFADPDKYSDYSNKDDPYYARYKLSYFIKKILSDKNTNSHSESKSTSVKMKATHAILSLLPILLNKNNYDSYYAKRGYEDIHMPHKKLRVNYSLDGSQSRDEALFFDANKKNQAIETFTQVTVADFASFSKDHNNIIAPIIQHFQTLKQIIFNDITNDINNNLSENEKLLKSITISNQLSICELFRLSKLMMLIVAEGGNKFKNPEIDNMACKFNPAVLYSSLLLAPAVPWFPDASSNLFYRSSASEEDVTKELSSYYKRIQANYSSEEIKKIAKYMKIMQDIFVNNIMIGKSEDNDNDEHKSAIDDHFHNPDHPAKKRRLNNYCTNNNANNSNSVGFPDKSWQSTPEPPAKYVGKIDSYLQEFCPQDIQRAFNHFHAIGVKSQETIQWAGCSIMDCSKEQVDTLGLELIHKHMHSINYHG